MLFYASHMRFRGSVEATAVVLGAVLLACVFTYPYIVNFNDAGRLDTNDGRWSIWVVSWVAHALTTDPSQLFRANIFYPHHERARVLRRQHRRGRARRADLGC